MNTIKKLSAAMMAVGMAFTFNAYSQDGNQITGNVELNIRGGLEIVEVAPLNLGTYVELGSATVGNSTTININPTSGTVSMIDGAGASTALSLVQEVAPSFGFIQVHAPGSAASAATKVSITNMEMTRSAAELSFTLYAAAQNGSGLWADFSNSSVITSAATANGTEEDCYHDKTGVCTVRIGGLLTHTKAATNMEQGNYKGSYTFTANFK